MGDLEQKLVPVQIRVLDTAQIPSTRHIDRNETLDHFDTLTRENYFSRRSGQACNDFPFRTRKNAGSYRIGLFRDLTRNLNFDVRPKTHRV